MTRLSRVFCRAAVVLALLGSLDALAGPGVGEAQSPRPVVTDAGWIAWADKVGIHLIRPNGTHLHALVARWGARDPGWSPNGRWLVYAQLSHYSDVNSHTYVAVIRPNGTGMRKVARGFEPLWLSNSWIVYRPLSDAVSTSFDASTPQSRALKMVNVNTGQIKAFVVPRMQEDKGWAARWNHQLAGETYFLSPDRKSISWLGAHDNQMSTCQNCLTLKSSKLDGSDFHEQTVHDTYWSDGGYWIPGGIRLGYSCVAGPHRLSSDICAVNMLTGKVTDVGGVGMDEWENPSPTGRRMVVGGLGALSVVTLGTKRRLILERVYTNSANPTHPTWQPVFVNK